jgi:hypothetical protein
MNYKLSESSNSDIDKPFYNDPLDKNYDLESYVVDKRHLK